MTRLPFLMLIPCIDTNLTDMFGRYPISYRCGSYMRCACPNGGCPWRNYAAFHFEVGGGFIVLQCLVGLN